MNKLDNIKVPNNIDELTTKIIDKAFEDRKKSKSIKFKKIINKMIAGISGLIIIGLINPSFASKIPLVGNVFELIEKNLVFPSIYSEYSTSVNEKASSNGIDVTLNEVVSDGYKLYLTYTVKRYKPFRYTYTSDKYSHFDVTQMSTTESYSNVSFTDKELKTFGITGLHGKFLDNKTFVGMHTYDLKDLGMDIPDEFEFTTKITSFTTENRGRKIPFISDFKHYRGTWAFKIPVKVDKKLNKEIKLDTQINGLQVNSITVTPLESQVELDFSKTNQINYIGLDNYEVKLYNGDKEIQQTSGEGYENISLYFFNSSTEKIKDLRLVINELKYEPANENTKSENTLILHGEDENDINKYEIIRNTIINKRVSID